MICISRRNFKNFLFIIAVAVVSNAFFIFPVSAAEISLDPASVATAVGSPFTVTIRVADVTDLFGVAFDLLFDPAVLKFVSSAEGDFLNRDGASPVFFAEEFDPGDVNVGYTRLPPEIGVTGGGNLMTMTFEALAEGSSNLAFLFAPDFSLIDSQSSAIPADWHDAVVTVTAGGETSDVVPPSIPVDLFAVATSSVEITLSWAASADDVGVAGYKVYRDGNEIATTTGIIHSDTGLAAATTYAYAVSAYDEAGNESERSEPTEATTLGELPPVIVGIIPPHQEATVGSPFTVTVSIADVTDLFGVAFDLLFDPNVLEFVSASTSPAEIDFFGQGGEGTLLNTAVNPAGDLIVGYTRFALDVGASGSGDLLFLTFKPTASGTSTLAFRTRPESLVTPGLIPIAATWHDGFVTTSSTPDTIPPVRTDGRPVGVLAAGTSQANLLLATNESAACRYTTTADSHYASTTDAFAETGGASHSDTVTGLQSAQAYTYYVRCIDGAGNVNTDDFPINFSIAAALIPAPPPQASSSGGGGGSGVMTIPLSIENESVTATTSAEGSVTISWQASDYSTGQVIYSGEHEPHTFDLNDATGIPPKYGYAYTTDEFDTNPKTIFHSATLPGLLPGTTYYYRTVSRGSFAFSQEYQFITREGGEQATTRTPPAEEKPAVEEKKPVQKERLAEEPGTSQQETKAPPRIQEAGIAQGEATQKIPASEEVAAASAAPVGKKYLFFIGGGVIAAAFVVAWRAVRRKTKQ